MLGYYHDKIKALEENNDEDNRTPICFTCNTIIKDVFYRIRYQENENHDIFKIVFHYFPPCFNFEKYYGVEDSYIITDGYEIDTKYVLKKKFTASSLARLDRLILRMPPLEIGSTDIPFGIVRTDKNQKTTYVRNFPVHIENKNYGS